MVNMPYLKLSLKDKPPKLHVTKPAAILLGSLINVAMYAYGTCSQNMTNTTFSAQQLQI